VREVAWSKNLEILAGCKRPEERAFYLRAVADQGWTKRELNRHIRAALFERVALGQASMSSALLRVHPEAVDAFKDSYTLDFLGLEAGHREADLQRGNCSTWCIWRPQVDAVTMPPWQPPPRDTVSRGSVPTRAPSWSVIGAGAACGRPSTAAPEV